MLTIKLFGPLDVRVGGVANPGSLAATELLALLALHHDRGLRSSWAAETIWPETGSLDSLRHAARGVRDILGEESIRLDLSNQTISLRLQGAEVDLIAFDDAIARAEEGDDADLPAAVSLYTGPLLEGWDNLWVLRQRETRSEQFLDALKKLAARSEAAGDHEAAVRYLRRLVLCRPRLESAWSDLMRSLVATGERLEAMEVYRRYRDYLHRAGKGKLVPPVEMDRQYEQLMALPRSIPPASSVSAELPASTGDYEAIGGAVPLNSPYYVVRPADAMQQAAIAHRDSILLIKGPRQIGKSSLLARGLLQARQAGAQIFMTDMQKLGAAQLETLDTFFFSLAQRLAAKIDGIAEPKQVWNSDWDPAANFERFLRREVLERLQTPVVWAIDEVDRLFHCEYKDDVFGLFRAWHNERSLEPDGPWGRLTLAMAYATEAHLFITNLNQSPFNVGTRLVLEDFAEQQVSDLCQRYGIPVGDTSCRIYGLVSGHPYLVRRCLYALQTLGMSMEAIEADAENGGEVFGAHVERVLQTLVQDTELMDAVRSNLLNGTPYTTAHFYRLRSAGMISGNAPGNAKPRCRLYDEFLSKRLI